MSSYSSSPRGGGRSFTQAIEICLRNYAGFEGRAPRSELWYWVLACLLAGAAVGLVAGVFDVVLGGHWVKNLLTGLLELFIFLPGLAVNVRRLHDIDKSGWWYFVVFIPLIGWIIMLVWFCTRGSYGPNRFGRDPLSEY